MKVAVVLLVVFGLLAASDAWRTGRATFYGDEPWLWDIHKGSCGYGYLDPNKGTGWDIAALPDGHYEFAGSCGRCYEVRCKPMTFRDNYGNTLDRQGACYDPNKVVKLTVTDTCPCNYSGNYYSNKRWCCMDMEHLDISVYTYDKLADRRWGVIGLEYRPVPCGGGSIGPSKRTDIRQSTNGHGSRMDWLKNAINAGDPSVQAFDGTGTGK